VGMAESLLRQSTAICTDVEALPNIIEDHIRNNGTDSVSGTLRR